jgi:type II secretory pathway component PulJ
MLVGILILSGFTWTLYNDNQNQSKALEKKNAEIETLNQRIRELS